MLITAIIGFLNLSVEALAAVAILFVNMLPPSPFLLIEKVNIPFLESLNWIIPFSIFTTIFGYWLSAILIYYAVQTILRWVQVIE